MNQFPQMAKVLSPTKLGAAEITHYEISKFDAMMSSMRGIPTQPGKCAVLKVNGQTVMSDTFNERRSNRQVVREARGDVLIAGLGLGMILHPILDKPEVVNVTVVEKCGDVISLIRPTLPDAKLTIVWDDIFEWKPIRGKRFDVIYFDIWPDMNADNLDEMKTLHARFRNYKTAGGWMDSWYREELRARR